MRAALENLVSLGTTLCCFFVPPVLALVALIRGLPVLVPLAIAVLVSAILIGITAVMPQNKVTIFTLGGRDVGRGRVRRVSPLWALARTASIAAAWCGWAFAARMVL